MKTEIEIYEESFGVDKEFETELFKCKIETLKVNGKTVSELFLLPCNIIKNGESYPANYVFAVATKQTERKKGYMEKLLKRVCDNDKILILRPSSEHLIRYYKKFGFTVHTASDKDNTSFFIEPIGEFRTLIKFADETNDGEFTLMSKNSPIDLNGVSFKFTMP